MAALELLKVLLAHDEVNIDGHSPVAVLIQREGADNRVRKILSFENRRQAVEGQLRFGFAHEESTTIGRTSLEPRFVLRGKSAGAP
jgi:hypothetical protein